MSVGLPSSLGAKLRPLPGPADAETLKALEPLSPSARAACTSVATVSPFLRDLMLADVQRLGTLMETPWTTTVDEACGLVPTADLARAGRDVRKARQQVALAVGLADLCGGASVTQVCHALSAFGQAAVRHALASVLLLELGDNAPEQAGQSGFVVLGMGKLGADELNYSSDIDLIVLFDQARALASGIDQRAAVRITRRMVSLLQERTEHGYAFRVDLRLRPDPSSTPLAVSIRAAINYMQSRARPWERQAMVKARQIAGDEAAGAAYFNAIAPSLWPASYDFGAIEDVFTTRKQIALVKGAGTLTVPQHNVKLGRGGIREVEFFVQSLQRVAGGRDRRLRGRSTLAMLAGLARAGWIEWQTADELSDGYRRLRRIEHALQMVADEQTHTLPAEDGLWRIATMLGEDEAVFERKTRETLATVHRHFLALPDIAGGANPTLLALVGESDPTEDAAQKLDALLTSWAEHPPASLRSERAQRLFALVRPEIESALSTAPDLDGAVEGLRLFFERLASGVDFLASVTTNRELVAVLVLIVSATPRLAEELARRAKLLDVLVDPAFFGRLQTREELETHLATDLGRADDYEGELDVLRQFGQEQMLLIHVRALSGSLSAPGTAAALTRLADVLVGAALTIATREFESAHGRVAGGAVALLALGKFGGGEMSATSDLDMVFLYDAEPGAGESDGRRGLSPGHYYTRLAQRLVAALSAPTAGGTLYEVDLRLRPAGRAGPLATHIRSFERYQAEDAWVWEHMALTRARVAAGDAALASRAMAAIDDSLALDRQRSEVAAEVISMRRRLQAEKGGGLKHALGGQVDVEFIAQYCQLVLGRRVGESPDLATVLPALAAAGALSGTAAESLRAAHKLYQALAQLLALASAKGLEPSEAPAALKPLLVRAGEAPDLAFLIDDLAGRRQQVQELFTAVIGPLEPQADPSDT